MYGFMVCCISMYHFVGGFEYRLRGLIDKCSFGHGKSRRRTRLATSGGQIILEES